MRARRWRSKSVGLAVRLAPLLRTDLARDGVRRDRSDGIDMLRAVFAIWVVLAHLLIWAPLAQGADAVPQWLAGAASLLSTIFQPVSELHPAVVGFIVLSGYCIHRAGLRTATDGAISGYAIRRFFRIAPIYYLAIIAGLIGFAIAASHARTLAETISGTTHLAAGCLAAKALVLAAFFPGLYHCAFLGNAPLATVLVEIVLYIVYAAAFAGLVWRGREQTIWYACGGLFLLSLPLLATRPNIYASWQNGSVFGFLPYWWLGVAFVNPAFAAACRRRLWLIASVWIAASALLMLTTPPLAITIAELRKLCLALGVGVLICAVDGVRLRRVGALALLGRAGYGLYAMHAPLTYTLVIYGVRWWLVLLANLAAGLIVHQAIERPLIDLGRLMRLRIASRAATAPAAD